MRQRYLLVLVGLVVALLALGALPSLLQSGAPYHVTATDVGNDSVPARFAVYDATNASDRRFPYLTSAIADGESAAYYEGPFGVKESFAHSPFDEFGAVETRAPKTVDGDVAYVRYEDTVYRLEIVQDETARVRATAEASA